MGALTAILTGIALAASAGLRAFLPLFAAALAARVLDWPLAPSLRWMATDPALIVFGVASLVEVVADKIPTVDHVLDVVQTVLSPVAGVVVMLSPLHGLTPTYAVALAIIAGAPLAGGVHALAAVTRLKSTATTGGLANPVLSVVEDIAAGLATILAFLAPLLIVIVAGLVATIALRRQRLAPRPPAA